MNKNPFDIFKPSTTNKDNIIIPDNTPFSNQYKGEIQFDPKGRMIKLPKRQGPELTDEIPKSIDPEYREKVSDRHYYLFTVWGIKMYEQCGDFPEALNMALHDMELQNKGLRIVGIFDKTGKEVKSEREIGKLWQKARREKGKRERHRIVIASDLKIE